MLRCVKTWRIAVLGGWWLQIGPTAGLTWTVTPAVAAERSVFRPKPLSAPRLQDVGLELARQLKKATGFHRASSPIDQ
jgi:hypothetical protein